MQFGQVSKGEGRVPWKFRRRVMFGAGFFSEDLKLFVFSSFLFSFEFIFDKFIVEFSLTKRKLKIEC